MEHELLERAMSCLERIADYLEWANDRTRSYEQEAIDEARTLAALIQLELEA